MSGHNRKHRGLEPLSSLLDQYPIPAGQHRFTIVDADQHDHHLPARQERTNHRASSAHRQQPAGSWVSEQLKAKRAERGARTESGQTPTPLSKSRELVLLRQKKSEVDADPIPAPMEQPPVCQICHGAGFLRQDVAYGHPAFGKPTPCRCKQQSRMQTLFGGAHIPIDCRTWSFERYLRLPLADTQRQAALLLHAFMRPRIQTYSGRKRGVYLYGDYGVGKTGLAISALQMAIQAGYSGLYLPTAELFDILYASIAASQRLTRGPGDETDREEEAAGAKLLRLVETVEWLVLDDLGVECASRFVISRLYRLLEGRRGESGLYTIFTSNKDARGLEQHWRPERPGAPAFDDCQRMIQRIGEYCTPIHVTGQSLREMRGNTHSS